MLTKGKGVSLLLIMAVVSLVALLAATPVLGGNEGATGLDKAKEVQEAHTNSLLATLGVHGTGVSVVDGEAVLVVYADATAVSSLPSVLDGVDVQAVETDMFVAGPIPRRDSRGLCE